jgi:hypothetical protein
MQTLHLKLQMHEIELFLRSYMVAESHTTSKNILNKEIGVYVVVHMCVAERAYKQRVETKNLLHPTSRFLLEG